MIKASQLVRTKNERSLQRGFRSRTRPLVLHGPSTRTNGTCGRNAMSTSAVTAMPKAHFTSSPITSPPYARTCRSAHMRPRSLPCISRSPHPFCPKAAELLEEAEADALAYLDFPYEHHVRLRTNNVQARANRELKRRSRVVQVFPSGKSLIRMMGAVFAEMDEDSAAAGSTTTPSAGPWRAPRSTRLSTPTRAPQQSTRQGSSRSSWPTTRFPVGRRRDMS